MNGSATDITIRAKYSDSGARRGLKSLGGMLSGLKGNLALITATIGTVTAIAGATIGASLEKNLSTVATVSQATAQEMAAITDEARRIGATTAYSATDASEGMIALARSGLRARQVISATGDSMKLAGATASDMGTATSLVAATFGQFGLQADQARRVVDTFAYATSRSLFDLPSLAEAMRYVGTTASGLGMSLEDAITAAAAFANMGLRGEQVGTTFRMAMVQLAGGTNQVREALSQVGLSFDDVNPVTHDYITLVDNLTKGYWNAGAAAQVFGTQAGLNMLRVIDGVKNGNISLREFRDGILQAQQGTGLAAQMYSRMMDNVAGDWEELKSAYEELQLTLFDGYRDTLRQMLKGTAEFVRDGTRYIGWFVSNSGALLTSLKKFVVLFFSDWDFFKAFLGALWMEFSWTFYRLVNTFGYFLIGIVRAAANASSVIWIPLATMFLYLVNTLKYHWKGLVNWLIEKLEQSWNMIPGIKIRLPRLDTSDKPNMKEYWAASWEEIKKYYKLIADETDLLMEGINQTWEGAGDYMKAALAPAMEGLGELNEEIKKVTDNVPVTPPVDDDDVNTIQNARSALDLLLERADNLASLGDLVGKGVLDKAFEEEVLQRKAKVIGELAAKLKELQGKPLTDESLGQINQLAEAYRKLTETRQRSLEDEAATISTLTELLDKNVLSAEYANDIMQRRTALLDELKAKIYELEALPVNTERLQQIESLSQAYVNLQQQARKSFEEQFNTAVGFKAKLGVTFRELGEEIKRSIPGALLDAISQGLQAISGFFSDLVTDSKSAASNFAATIIGAMGQIAQVVGTLIFLAGLGFLSLGWISGGQAIAAGLALMALGGVAQGLATRMRQNNAEKTRQEQEQSQSLREGVARNTEATTKKTEVTVKVQDSNGKSVLDGRGQREAQRIVLESLKGLKDQGKLQVVMA